MPVRESADDDGDMHASRGLIALLVGTVVFFALWIVALKPGGSNSASGGAPTQGLSGYQADIAKAHQAVQISGASNAQAAGEPVASTPATAGTTRPATSTATATAPKTSAHAGAPTVARRAAHAGIPKSVHTAIVKTTHRASAAARQSQVQRAIRAHKVVALLFYNPAGADDQAVKQELAAVPTHRGRVVKLTIPLSEIANYTVVTEQVPVNFSPTLVLVAPTGQADEIIGFSDQFEIAQRVDQALATRRR